MLDLVVPIAVHCHLARFGDRRVGHRDEAKMLYVDPKFGMLRALSHSSEAGRRARFCLR